MGENTGDSFDYVIVGAGAAGCVLANRLTETPGVTVCLLEAGPPDRNPWIHIPAGFTKTLFDPAFTWQFKTEPTEMTGGRAIATTQGRTLGGGSSVNGMVYNRGQPADLDNWAQRGNRGWATTTSCPTTARARCGLAPAENVAGAAAASPSPTWTGSTRSPKPSSPAASASVSHAIPTTTAATRPASAISSVPSTRAAGSAPPSAFFARPSAAARWKSAPPTPAPPTSSSKASAPSASPMSPERNGTPHEIRARREVIVSAGTVNTARLLQISGIGPAGLLGELGVEVRHELSGVGENFRDHFAPRFVMRAKPGTPTLNEIARGPRLAKQVAQWATGKPSILATAPSHVHVFWKSWDGADAPDLQCVFTPGSYQQGKTYILDDYPGMTAGAWPHRPESKGHVRARSTDPFVDPVIQPNYLSDPMDRRVMLGGMRLLRRMLGTPSWVCSPNAKRYRAPPPRATTNSSPSPARTAPRRIT